MADTLDFINVQKEKLRDQLKEVIDFLDKVPESNGPLSFEILQFAALLVAGLQTCDEAIEAIANDNNELKKACLVELDMLRELFNKSIDSAKALEQVH